MKNKTYLSQEVFNRREREIQKEYEARGFVVLKRGYPDLFCVNRNTKEFEFVEVKSKNQYFERTNPTTGKITRRLGLTTEQMRMHQHLRNCGLKVVIRWVE